MIKNNVLPYSTIHSWIDRLILSPLELNGITYIPYSEIPLPSRSKLPPEDVLRSYVIVERYDAIVEGYYIRLYNAFEMGFIQYLDKYKALFQGSGDKALRSAKRHAVMKEVLDIHGESTAVRCKPSLMELHVAYNKIYTDGYNYFSFSKVIGKAKKSGIESIVIDKRTGRKPKFGALHEKWLIDLLSIGKAYTPKHMHENIRKLCIDCNQPVPSLAWVAAKATKLLPTVEATRYGQIRAGTKLPYMGVIRALNPGDQWQIDGWRLPFYMEGYRTLTLFAVMDACTGMIVGYYVSNTENTESILKGLEHAVSTTGHLPFEIVSDKHSFNKTGEAKNFKETLKNLGCAWTVTSNPRRKGIIERNFGTFGSQQCKGMYGYIGEGIRTRRKNGRTSQELMDKYTKTGGWLTEEQIKLTAIDLILRYNEKLNKSLESRSERYRTMDKPHAIPVSELDRMSLFIRETVHLVRRGQIDIVREGVKYEFQLNKDQHLMLNDKEVAVRYFNFDSIYLFDVKTNKPLGEVPRKKYAHGALANQTDEDVKLIMKHKGRVNSINTAFKRKQVDIAKEAENIDPDAAYRMNQLTTPKLEIEEFRTLGEKRRNAIRLGVEPDYVTDIPEWSEVETLRPDGKKDKNKRSKESPLTPLNHTPGIIPGEYK